MKPKEPAPGRAEVSRDELAIKLSRDEVLQAQQLAEACIAANYNGFD